MFASWIPQQDTPMARVATVVAHALPFARTASLRIDRPLEPNDWRQVLEVVRAQRVAGLFSRALRMGCFEATPAQRAELDRLQTYFNLRTLWLESQLVDLVQLLDEASIDVRVLKGASFAHSLYPSPDLRAYGDVDLLVRRRDLDRSIAVISSQRDARRVHAEPRPGFVARFGKSVELVDGQLSIDLHCSLAPGAWAVGIDTDRLFEDPMGFEVVGRTLLGLGREARFLHACFHATVGNVALKLGPLIDLTFCLADPAFDLRRAVRRANENGATAVMAEAVKLSLDLFALELGHDAKEWASTYVPTSREVRLFESRRSTDPGVATATVPDMLRAIPRPTAKLRYLAALVAPSREYLDERDETNRRRLVRAASVALRRA